MRIQEGTCLDVSIQIDGVHAGYGGVDEWLDISCVTHEWECGHKHTRWGPILRCLTRHVASMVEEEE